MPTPKYSLMACALVLLWGAYGCSTSQKSGDSDPSFQDGGSSFQSTADSVGSIPEDMLSDEKGPEATTADGAAAPTADPFGDLKDDSNHAATTTDDAASLLSEGGSSAGTGTMDTYTVKAGDTLMKIAFSIYGDIDRWKDLQEWNRDHLKRASAIRAGMKLKYDVPASAFQPEQLSHTYEIKSGDTLAGIADEVYGRRAKYKKLQNYNVKLIKNPNRIFAGFTIFYEISEKEVAEAEARRQQRAAGGEAVPSAISPPVEEAPAAGKSVATSPPAPASTGQVGPPTPGQ